MCDCSERLPPHLDIRAASADDIPEILRQRRTMYESMDYRDSDLLAAMVSVSAAYLAKALANESFRAWLAQHRRPLPLAEPSDLPVRLQQFCRLYDNPLVGLSLPVGYINNCDVSDRQVGWRSTSHCGLNGGKREDECK